MFAVLRISSRAARVEPAMKINNNTCLVFYIYIPWNHHGTILYYIFMYCVRPCSENIYIIIIIELYWRRIVPLCCVLCTKTAVKCGDHDSRVLRSSHPANKNEKKRPSFHHGKGCRNTGPTRRDNIILYYIVVIIIITFEECDLILFATIKMKDYCTTIKGCTGTPMRVYDLYNNTRRLTAVECRPTLQILAYLLFSHVGVEVVKWYRCRYIGFIRIIMPQNI